jgi:hypothetical protein
MSLAKKAVYGLLVLIMIVGVVSAVWTVIPDSSSYVSLSYEVSALGYNSHCPWAPYSTIISIVGILFAAIIFFIARRSWR